MTILEERVTKTAMHFITDIAQYTDGADNQIFAVHGFLTVYMGFTDDLVAVAMDKVFGADRMVQFLELDPVGDDQESQVPPCVGGG